MKARLALELAATREQGISGTLVLSKKDPARRVFSFFDLDLPESEAIRVDFDELLAAAPACGLAVIQTAPADGSYYTADENFGGYIVVTPKATWNYFTDTGFIPVNLTPQVRITINKLPLNAA